MYVQELKKLKELKELRQQSLHVVFKQQDIRLNSLTSLTPLTSLYTKVQ